MYVYQIFNFTEILNLKQHQIFKICFFHKFHLSFEKNYVYTATSARSLGSWFDSKVSMSTYITKLSSSSFYHFISAIFGVYGNISQGDVPRVLCMRLLLLGLIPIDYCNSLSDYRITKLQRIQNAAARLICQQSRFCHITSLLFDSHWLPVKFRIEFKVLLITFKALKVLAPTYIGSLISIKSTSRRYDLRSSNDSLLLILIQSRYPRQHWVIALLHMLYDL